jgi:hypothetical protein
MDGKRQSISDEDGCGIKSNEKGNFENSHGTNWQVDNQGQCKCGAEERREEDG